MEREPQGEMYMQRRVFLARLFVQAKCGRAARMHRQKEEREGREEERRSSRQKHRHTGSA